MEIDTTINKWFEETAAQIETHVKTDSVIDMSCVSILKTTKNYCNATLLLLSKGHKMPAKALLRVLCELTVKFLWCMFIPDENKQDPDNVIYEKFRRWAKHSLLETSKTLRGFRNAGTEDFKNEVEGMIGKLEKNAGSIELSAMPPLGQMWGQLPEPWKGKIKPMFYLRFNNAVHLDMKSLRDLIVREEDKLFCVDDSEENVQDLAECCIAFAFDVNFLIRRHYDWSVDQMDKDRKMMLGI